MTDKCSGKRVDGGGVVTGFYCEVDGKHYILEESAQVADMGPRGIEVAGFVEVTEGSVNGWLKAEDGPADQPTDWDEKVLVLEWCSDIPSVITLAQLWLDEGSEVELYKYINLPEDRR